MPYKKDEQGRALNRIAAKKHYDAHPEFYRERNRKARNKKAEYIRRLREKPCTDCKNKFPWYVMEFDHRENKSYSIPVLRSHSWKRLREELAKCDLVCANCHAIRTYERVANRHSAAA